MELYKYSISGKKTIAVYEMYDDDDDYDDDYDDDDDDNK
jgi:hypothetical protein